MHRTEVNLETGEIAKVDLTAEEVAEAQAQKAAWDAEQAALPAPAPTLLEIITALQAKVTALEAK